MSESIQANVQGFSAIVQQQAAAMQMAANAAPGAPVLTFSPGSIWLAVCQAAAGVWLWLQGICLSLLLYGRASTCVGVDLDSWMAQFQFTRIPATGAICRTILLSRYTTGTQVDLSPGGVVQTAVGGIQYVIIADPAQPTWDVATQTYNIGTTDSSCQVTAQATTLGAVGNVVAGAINQFGSGVIGFDTVTNTGAASGGANAEADPAFLARFWLYLQYLFRATGPAVIYAIQTIQPGLAVTITDGYNEAGQLTPGYFFATVDDGSGSPSAALIAAAATQAYNTRALGINSAAHGPNVLTVSVIATVVTSNALVDGPAANQAIVNFFAGIVLGGGADYFRLGTAIQNASQTITELSTLTLNGVAAPIAGLPRQKIEVGTITVNT